MKDMLHTRTSIWNMSWSPGCEIVNGFAPTHGQIAADAARSLPETTARSWPQRSVKILRGGAAAWRESRLYCWQTER